MKKITFILFVAALSAVAATDAKPQALLNGGFENWKYSRPTDFIVTPRKGAPIAADDKVVKEGKYSLRIDSTVGKSARMIQESFAIKNITKPICIRGWMKYENLAAKDEKGKKYTMPIVSLWTYLPNGRNSLIFTAVSCKPGSRDWFKFEKVFTPEEIAAKIARLPENRRPTYANFRITVYSQPGTVWLDNVEMFEVSDEKAPAEKAGK